MAIPADKGETPQNAKRLSANRDRLEATKKRRGIKRNGKAQDQKATVKGNPSKAEREPGAKADKLEAMYRRKRHP